MTHYHKSYSGFLISRNVVFQDLGLFALFGLPATLAAGAVAALATRTRLPEYRPPCSRCVMTATTPSTLSPALAARGFQPLFALRRGTADVSFEADDGAWSRIEAYPEYVRVSAAPPASFLVPPWEPELTPFVAAVHRFRAIL